jgi:hypothetical protein
MSTETPVSELKKATSAVQIASVARASLAWVIHVPAGAGGGTFVERVGGPLSPTTSASTAPLSRSAGNNAAIQRNEMRMMGGHDRAVRFIIVLHKVKDYDLLRSYIEKGLRPELYDVGLDHEYIYVNVNPVNTKCTRVQLEIVIKRRRGFSLNTGHDVYLHYVYWLRRGRYTIRSTLAECTTPVLTHSLIDSDDEAPPAARRLRSIMLHYKENAPANAHQLRSNSLTDDNKIAVATRLRADSPGVSRSTSNASSSSSLSSVYADSWDEPLPPISPTTLRRRTIMTPRRRGQRLFRRHTTDFGREGAHEFLNLLV